MPAVSTVTKPISGESLCGSRPSLQPHQIVEDQPPSEPLDLGPTGTRLGVATVRPSGTPGDEHCARRHFGPTGDMSFSPHRRPWVLCTAHPYEGTSVRDGLGD